MMNIDELKRNLESYYDSKDIAQCRYNALNKVVCFMKEVFKDYVRDMDFLKQVDKQKLKLLYESRKESKKISGAESQVFNDMYNYLNNK